MRRKWFPWSGDVLSVSCQYFSFQDLGLYENQLPHSIHWFISMSASGYDLGAHPAFLDNPNKTMQFNHNNYNNSYPCKLNIRHISPFQWLMMVHTPVDIASIKRRYPPKWHPIKLAIQYTHTHTYIYISMKYLLWFLFFPPTLFIPQILIMVGEIPKKTLNIPIFQSPSIYHHNKIYTYNI